MSEAAAQVAGGVCGFRGYVNLRWTKQCDRNGCVKEKVDSQKGVLDWMENRLLVLMVSPWKQQIGK